MGVAAFQEQLTMISTTATQEHEIDVALKAIDLTWKEQVFNMKQHKEQQTWLLADNKEVQDKLDDTLTQIVNILGNRFVKSHLETAQRIADQLNMVSETYDRWREAQRGWLYLDNIF